MIDASNIPSTAEYSLPEAATILGVTRQTINRWCRDGKIRFGIRRHNGRKFFKGIDLKMFSKSII